jgi:hypothetical protein
VRLSDSQLAVLLMESERFDEIVRDDEFWRALESISPDAQEIAVRDRFMALVADEKSELQIESYAKIAVNVVETVRRWGPAEARKKLRPTSH